MQVVVCLTGLIGGSCRRDTKRVFVVSLGADRLLVAVGTGIEARLEWLVRDTV
jgi:hypothetical protein